MSKTPLTLHEARTYAALAVATSLTTSAALGAGTSQAAGTATGLLVAGATALLTTGGALGTLRLLVTAPEPHDGDGDSDHGAVRGRRCAMARRVRH
jgi:hypothetical protein